MVEVASSSYASAFCIGLRPRGISGANSAKTLVTAVCRNVCKKIALASKFFQPEKPRRPSEVTRFVATSTARGRCQGLGGVSSAVVESGFLAWAGSQTTNELWCAERGRDQKKASVWILCSPHGSFFSRVSRFSLKKLCSETFV